MKNLLIIFTLTSLCLSSAVYSADAVTIDCNNSFSDATPEKYKTDYIELCKKVKIKLNTRIDKRVHGENLEASHNEFSKFNKLKGYIIAHEVNKVLYEIYNKVRNGSAEEECNLRGHKSPSLIKFIIKEKANEIKRAVLEFYEVHDHYINESNSHPYIKYTGRGNTYTFSYGPRLRKVSKSVIRPDSDRYDCDNLISDSPKSWATFDFTNLLPPPVDPDYNRAIDSLNNVGRIVVRDRGFLDPNTLFSSGPTPINKAIKELHHFDGSSSNCDVDGSSTPTVSLTSARSRNANANQNEHLKECLLLSTARPAQKKTWSAFINHAIKQGGLQASIGKKLTVTIKQYCFSGMTQK